MARFTTLLALVVAAATFQGALAAPRPPPSGRPSPPPGCGDSLSQPALDERGFGGRIRPPPPEQNCTVSPSSIVPNATATVDVSEPGSTTNPISETLIPSEAPSEDPVITESVSAPSPTSESDRSETTPTPEEYSGVPGPASASTKSKATPSPVVNARVSSASSTRFAVSSAPRTSTSKAPTSTTTNSSTTNGSSSGTSGSTSSSDQQAYLDAHNKVRRNHGASDLTWSSELASAAQKWANNCKWQHSQGAVGKFGENLSAGTNLDIAGAIKMWTDEVVDYDPANPQYSHFTQVVWKGTTQVGCAVQTCNGLLGGNSAVKYYVCEYNPAGNIIGKFGENVQV